MRLNIFVLQDIFRKYLCNRNFLKKSNAENLQDFVETAIEFEFLLDNGHEYINADSDPNLGFHGVF